MKRLMLFALFLVLTACAPSGADERPMITPSPPVLGTPLSYPLPVSPPALKATAYPAPPSEGTPMPAITPQNDIPRPLRPARDYLAQRLDVSPEEIHLATYEPTNFPDGCLGLPNPGEMCIQVITPGYVVTFQTDKGNFIFHVARSGYPFRMVGSNYEIQDK